MAPTTRSSKTSRKASKPKTRSYYKKKLVKPKRSSSRSVQNKTSSSTTTTTTVLEDILASSSSSTICSDNNNKNVGFDNGNGGDADMSSPCSTPKAQRFRIPKLETCPPAPKKQRVLSNNCSSLQRTPIAFFAPPDLEFFFFLALRDISV